MEATASAETIQAAPPARSGRFVLNLVSNVGKLALTMVVGAWYVPFLIRQLGPAAYGLVPLASMITSYMALVTFGLDSAVARLLTISLEKEDHKQANLVFNVALWGNLAVAVLLAIPAAAVIANVEHLLRVPPGYETATRWLFVGTVAAFLVNLIRTPFAVSGFCRNRLDLLNILVVSETLTRVGLVVSLFVLLSPRIEYVGAGILAGTTVSAIGTLWLWKKVTPTLHIRPRDFDWQMLKGLGGTGGWVMVSQVGVMLIMNIDLLVANRLFGPDEGGRFAAVLQVPLLLQTMGVAVGEIFAPTMFQMYARGELEQLTGYLNRAIKFLGIVMALTIGLICGFARPLLQLWLGPEFGNSAPLLCVMVILLCLNLPMYPLYAVPLAANRVKVPAIATVVIGLINLLLALALTLICGWGLYGVAAAGAISLTLRRFVFTPLYVAGVLHQPGRTFYRRVIPISVATAATIALCRFIVLGWGITSWLDLGIAATAVSVVFLAVSYLRLVPDERLALKDMVVQWRR